MDIKKICRLCFQTDIKDEFVNMTSVPGLIEEIAMVYSVEVSEENGISTLICAECHNKTITIAFHLENVRKVQEKIKALQDFSAPNGSLPNKSLQSTIVPAKVLSSNRKRHQSSVKKAGNNSENSSKAETFEDGEEVEYYDIHLKRSVSATVINRVTHGQYAIRVNGRIVLRKAIFLIKKLE